MFKNRRVRRLLGGSAVTLGMLAMALPAHAGTVTVTDASGDTLDPVLTQNNATAFRTPSPSADITSYSLTSTTLNGQPALTATINVAGTIPAEGSTDPTAYQGPHATGLADTGQEYPSYIGGTYLVAYADTRTERNTYTLAPGCTNAATGAPIYDFQGSWQDGYRDYLAVEVTFDGQKWNATPEIGQFNPEEDGGFGFVDLQSEPEMAGKFTYSLSAHTVSITVQTAVTTTDADCVGGVFTQDFGKVGDTLASVTGMTTVDQVAVLPVAVPLSVTGLSGDVQAIGGLVGTVDWANQAGYSLGNAGWPIAPYSIAGPTCPTPTFGGTLPRNPLFVDGQPCNIINPADGAGFHNSGTSITY